MKSFLKATMWCVLAAVILCSCPGGSESDKDKDDKDKTKLGYDMTGVYTFERGNYDGLWVFFPDKNHEVSGYGINSNTTGTWSSEGNIVTITYGTDSEEFVVSRDGNEVTLVRKDGAQSVLLNSWGIKNTGIVLTLAEEDLNADPTEIEMVQFGAGVFYMGSPNDEPGHGDYSGATARETQHKVTLSASFYIGKYPVTQKQWIAVMGARDDPTTVSYGKGDRYPVYNVSWYDALVYCNKLSIMKNLTPVYSIGGSTNPENWGPVPVPNYVGADDTTDYATWNAVTMVPSATGYRLPTEAEWEYACRGEYPNKATEQDTKPFAIGDGTKMISGLANFDVKKPYDLGHEPPGGYEDSDAPGYLGRAAPVGSYSHNNRGLYDMHGNVYEWCWDCFTEILTEASNPVINTPVGLRVFRGGGYGQRGADLRSAHRSYNHPKYKNATIGFRVVRR